MSRRSIDNSFTQPLHTNEWCVLCKLILNSQEIGSVTITTSLRQAWSALYRVTDNHLPQTALSQLVTFLKCFPVIFFY